MTDNISNKLKTKNMSYPNNLFHPNILFLAFLYDIMKLKNRLGEIENLRDSMLFHSQYMPHRATVLCSTYIKHAKVVPGIKSRTQHNTPCHFYEGHCGDPGDGFTQEFN